MHKCSLCRRWECSSAANAQPLTAGEGQHAHIKSSRLHSSPLCVHARVSLLVLVLLVQAAHINSEGLCPFPGTAWEMWCDMLDVQDGARGVCVCVCVCVVVVGGIGEVTEGRFQETFQNTCLRNAKSLAVKQKNCILIMFHLNRDRCSIKVNMKLRSKRLRSPPCRTGCSPQCSDPSHFFLRCNARQWCGWNWNLDCLFLWNRNCAKV